MGISTLMLLALSICVLFILLMQSVNGRQFVNTTSILLFSLPVATSATVIVQLTSIYGSLSSHKLDFNIEVSNLI